MNQLQQTHEVGLAEAQRQVRDSIEAQHPGWRDQHGECAPCARFEHELAAQSAGQSLSQFSNQTTQQ